MAGDGTENKRLAKEQHRIHDIWWSPSSDAILVALEIEQARNQLENWIVAIGGKSTKRWRTSRWAKGWRHWDVNGAKVNEPRNRLMEALPEGTKWPVWSPDGKQILFYTAGKICVAAVENGSFTKYRNLSPYSGWDAAWSPDGSRIAFVGRDSAGRDTSEIFLLDVETGNMRQITPSTHGYLDLHWR